MASGLIIAASHSGGGKTLLTLGILRHLTRLGVAVASAKAGPDYIDPAFHAAASGRPCFSLDTWAMRSETLGALITRLTAEAALILVEGVMGLFDGATGVDHRMDGSTASLAAVTGWPVVLVVDTRGQALSAAALVQGFARFRSDLPVKGVILNRARGPHHVEMVRAALVCHVPETVMLGAIPEERRLTLPARHLGLVQARELPELETFLEMAADVVSAHVDLEALQALARPAQPVWPAAAVTSVMPMPPLVPPLGQRIAVALDNAFAFVYPAVLNSWHDRGAEIVPFSPLNDEPPPRCDAVYLPGGYPELHASVLAGNARFMTGLRAVVSRSTVVFGECGGYVVLGHGLIDTDGKQHAMAGVLPLVTSFAQQRLHLGYRIATLTREGPWGSRGLAFHGHEFHYMTVVREGPGEPLFTIADAVGRPLGQAGLRQGKVMGSFIHLIDIAGHCRPGK